MTSQNFFGNKLLLMQLTLGIGLSLHLSATIHLMKFGIIKSQMSLIFMNLGHLPGFYTKDRLNNKNYNDDGSNSVLYYSVDTCRILSSRNFHFLTQTTTPPAANDIELNPAPEGEKREKAPVQITDKLNENGKCNVEENFEQKTRGKQVDY